MKPRHLSAACMVLAFTAPSAFGQTRFWSGNGSAAGGPGTWNTTSNNWGTAAAGPYTLAWDNAGNHTAEFNTTTGSITLATNVTVGRINAKTGASGNTLAEGAGLNTITLGLTNTIINNAANPTTGRSLVVNARLIGSNNLSIVGPATTAGGTVTLGRANTYTGTTTVNNTTLAIGAAGQLNSGDYSNTISLATANSFLVYNSSLNQILGGNMTGTGRLTKGTSAASVLSLSGANSYSGGTSVDAGTLSFRNTGARPATGTVTVAAGATLGLGVGGAGFFTAANVDSLFAGTLSGVTNDITSNVGIDTTQASFTYATSVAGSPTRGLVKLGANTLTLTGSSTYTGATTVSEGVLAVNGSLANTSTTVGSTATLQGSGTIGGSVTIQSGGTLAAGNSIESLGTGALSFAAGSTFAYELQTNLYGSTPNESADLTHSTGTLDITAGAILTLTDLATSTALALNSKLTLISYFGGWTGTELFTYNLATLNDGDTFTLGANLWEFNYDDTTGGPNYSSDQATGINARFVTLTVVPESSAVLLGGLGALMLLRRRRI